MIKLNTKYEEKIARKAISYTFSFIIRFVPFQVRIYQHRERIIAKTIVR